VGGKNFIAENRKSGKEERISRMITRELSLGIAPDCAMPARRSIMAFLLFLPLSGMVES
jgi:hypothetical protein